jgi:hypothetical protein
MNERTLDTILAALPEAPSPADVADLRRLAVALEARGAVLSGHAWVGGQLRLTFRDDTRAAELGPREARAWLRRLDAGAPDPWQDLSATEGARARRPEEER